MESCAVAQALVAEPHEAAPGERVELVERVRLGHSARLGQQPGGGFAAQQREQLQDFPAPGRQPGDACVDGALLAGLCRVPGELGGRCRTGLPPSGPSQLDRASVGQALDALDQRQR
jgi:hypothetical protein